MPRDPFGKLTPGDQLETIHAQTWNSFIDAANYVKRRNAGREAGTLGVLNETGRVLCKNSSGSTQAQYNVMRITGVSFDPGTATALEEFKNTPVLTVDVPDTTILAKYVILQEPLANNEIGWGLIAGITPVQIDVKDSGDDFADPINADATKLRSQPYGQCEILYKQAGTGTKWGYVVHGLQGSQFAIGKTSGTLNKGSSGTINVYRGTTKGSETYTAGDDISNVYNRFANVASGKWVLCIRIQGGWELAAAEC